MIIQKVFRQLKRFIRSELRYIKWTWQARFAALKKKGNPVSVLSFPEAEELFLMGGLACENSEHMRPIAGRIAETLGVGEKGLLLTYTKTIRREDSLPENVLDVRRRGDVILELRGGKVGVSVFKKKVIPSQVIRRRARLKAAGAKVFVAYYRPARRAKGVYMKVINAIGRCGYGAVVGLRPEMMSTKRMRAHNLSNTYLFYSLGDMTDRMVSDTAPQEELSCDIAALRLGFDFQRGNVARQTYYPLNIRDYQEEIPSVHLCRRDSRLDTEIRTYNRVKTLMRSFHAADDELLLSTLMAWCGAALPRRWQYLGDYSVGAICSRTFEVAPGSVYFFRPQYRDPNDKPTNDFLRLRLVWRVWKKKSLFILSYRRLPWFVPHAVLPDVNEAHISSIAAYRRRLGATFIAVTGSIGKTSTKDMLFNVLNQDFVTEKSAHNANVQVYIGMAVQNVRSNTEYFIQEVGGGRPGGASRHSRMILPHIAMITNIGTAHIGNYGSQEELMRNKLGITAGLDENGVLALNYDDRLLRTAKPDCRLVTYAIHNHDADVYADNVREDNDGIRFELVHGQNRYPVRLGVHGVHNALNAAGSFAVGTELGMSPEHIIAGIEQFQTTGIRQNMVDYNGYHLLVDCYNASVESIDSSLTTLSSLKPEGRKVAVIGDVTGTGDSTETVNSRIAKTAIAKGEGFDTLVLFGENAGDIRGKLTGAVAEKCLVFTQRPELEKWLQANLKAGDLALFKASSKIRLDEIIDNAFGTGFSDEKFIQSNQFGVLTRGGVKYRLFKHYGSVIGADRSAAEVSVEGTVSGRPINNVFERALAGSAELETVHIGPHIRGIQKEAFAGCAALRRVTGMEELLSVGPRAFADCTALERFDCPDSLRFINEGAFSGCTALHELRIGDSVESIGEEAFAGCTALKRVELPASVRVARSAFNGCPDVELIRR